MSTTTIRLPDELKARIHSVAQARGLTAHALILEAISEKADSGERRLAFIDAANARMSRIADSGETISWQDMRTYLKARTKGRDVERPKALQVTASRGQD